MAPFALVSMPYKVVKAPQLFGKVPNILGAGVGLATNNNSEYDYSHWSGSLTPIGLAWGGYERATDQTNRDFGTQFDFFASRSSSIYGASDTVQPQSIRALVLIRSY